MARLLILYGTTDGQTAKIARFVATELRRLGAEVDVCNAATADPDPRDYAGVVVAASVHAGGYQRSVVRWTRRHATALAERRAEFLSICLGVLEKDPKVLAELGRIKGRFAAKTGWQPAYFELVAGALPYTRYGWLKRWIMKRIVAKAHGDTDTSRDYEYTDWEALKAFAESFFSLCMPGSNRSSCGSAATCGCHTAEIAA